MIILTNKNRTQLQNYVAQLSTFLKTYKWITDVYVSDFFIKDHFEGLPRTWKHALVELTTQEMSGLLESSPLKSKQVLPLTLLSFKTCCQTFSIDRQQERNVDNTLKNCFRDRNKEKLLPSLFSGLSAGSSPADGLSAGSSPTDGLSAGSSPADGLSAGSSPADGCSAGSSLADDAENLLNPTDTSGKLHAFFRKHVKPKKQHEITSLAQVIHLLCTNIECPNVVDVGSGLGHLTRVLSFGYGLNVTSIEATDAHGPKASKYDREIDREIRKKNKMAHGCLDVSQPGIQLPYHLTHTISPNMETNDFVSLLKSKHSVNNYVNNLMCSTTQNHQCDLSTDHTKGNIEGSVEMKMGHFQMSDNTELNVKPELLISDTIGSDVSSLCLLHSNKQCCHGDKNISLHCKKFRTVEYPKYNSTGNQSTTICNSSSDTHISDILKTYQLETVNSQLEELEHGKSCDNESPTGLTSFVFTGLHACGDLTPTFLKFFVNCTEAKALASVGCCYMKLTVKSAQSDQLGYPLSIIVKELPDHQLSYVSLELACHFVETYTKRLKENHAHLKIHSYRAALEWLVNQLCPNSKRSSVQIPAKKSNQMQFHSYVKLGLEKFGISDSCVTEDMIQTATQMTARWKDVVAFYTIRLALAPVVETLVLLDRLFYLDENGYTSALVPIFNPSLSPRNFVLLSWKD